MNSDSLFDSDFFHEHKGLITVLSTVTLAFLTIFWLYKGLKSNERNNNQNVNLNEIANLMNDQNVNKKVNKRRLTINTQDILYSDLNNLDISFIYQVLDNLSKQFDLYLIITLNDNDRTDKILEQFSTLCEDGIIFKHRILFTSKIEGTCAMIRSIDPFAHIESKSYVVTNLLRFVNEFWFVNLAKENLEEKVMNDSNLVNNAQTLMNKIKIYDDFEGLLNNINIRFNSK